MNLKKSLGQHFLKNRDILEKIIQAGKIEPDDIILEVGPGEGILTESILKKAGKVVAIEKDDRLIPVLQKKFASEISSDKLELVHADILSFNPSDYKLKANSYKLIANLPYYITGKFIRKFLETDNQPNLMVLMLQKEVAERIVAKNGRESLLSISVKTYGQPKYLKTVPAKFFNPPPKVDSAVISIENINRDFFRNGKINERKFFEILKAGFSQKRKVLKKKLLLFADQKNLDDAYQKCGIGERDRAENLSVSDWNCLVKQLSN